MRRTAGLVMVGAGVFLLVLAVMLKAYAEPRIVRVSLTQQSSTQSRSDGNSAVLDAGTLSVRSGLTLTSNREVRGDLEAARAAGDDDVAVWRTGNSLLDEQGNRIRVTEETVAFDRVTGLAVNCCGEQVDGDPSVRHDGLFFKFPFDTEQKDYPFWDGTAGRAFPMTFDGVEERDGLELYRFVQQVPETQIRQVQVPPRLLGETGDDLIEAATVYSNTRRVWVEPASGIIVRGQESARQVLQVAGTDRLTVFSADIGYTPQTEARALDDARSTAADLFRVRILLPAVAVVGGLLLLLAGLALLFADGRTRRTSGRRAAGRPTPAAGIPVQSPPTPDDGRRPDVVDLRDVPDAPTAVDAGPVDRPGDR